MKIILLVAIVIAATNVQADDTKPQCASKTLYWHIYDQKSRDSSLNSDYRLIQEEGLNRVVKGLIGWTAALDVETKSNVATLCEVIESQQAQLDELKNQVESLRKQMARMNSPARRTVQTTK